MWIYDCVCCTLASSSRVLLVRVSAWWSLSWKSLGVRIAGANRRRKKKPLMAKYFTSYKRETVSITPATPSSSSSLWGSDEVLTSFSGSGNCSSTRLWSCLNTTLITGGHWETEFTMASMMLVRYIWSSPTLLSLTSASDAEPLNDIRLETECVFNNAGP